MGKDKTKSFAKEQFLQSKQRPGIDRDILSVVLEHGKLYTMAEAEKLVGDFKKGKVK